MRYLKAFVLGSIAVSVMLGAAVAVLSAVAASGAVSEARVALGRVALVSVHRAATSTETTLGPGLALVGLAGGAANAALLGLLGRRGRRADPMA